MSFRTLVRRLLLAIHNLSQERWLCAACQKVTSYAYGAIVNSPAPTVLIARFFNRFQRWCMHEHFARHSGYLAQPSTSRSYNCVHAGPYASISGHGLLYIECCIQSILKEIAVDTIYFTWSKTWS